MYLLCMDIFPLYHVWQTDEIFFWCYFTFFFSLDLRGWIKTRCTSIILSEIIEWSMRMIRTRDVLRKELIPAPNPHFMVEVNKNSMLIRSESTAYLWSGSFYSSKFLKNRNAYPRHAFYKNRRREDQQVYIRPSYQDSAMLVENLGLGVSDMQ